MQEKSILKRFAILDWLVVIILLVLGVFAKRARFPSDFIPYLNTDIDEPTKTTTVSKIVLYPTIVVGGIIVLISFGIFKRELLSQILASYSFSIVFTLLVVSLLQRMIGRPRPDTKSYCGATFLECSFNLNEKQLNEQFKSFPSLESALSMASGIFISFFIIESWKKFSVFQALISLLPVFLAIFYGACEIWDRNSHIDDVVTGYFIGGIISIFTFKSLLKSIRGSDEYSEDQQHLSDSVLLRFAH
ncbi:PAP2 superfamily protein [Histomonas meleagridis]|uniref:PAP2 superfamily protein n=1 Tax=Histomonas meleagridis TaxID=135588 RepID=UPI00355A3DEF|nr:PAP2 superfamily protein [Histomonas meleagridis]